MAHYRTHAQAYFDATQGVDMAPLYARFMPLLPPGAHVLDAGCGSGRDALAFRRMGFAVEAFDASPELAALAQGHTGLPVQVMSFQQMADAMGNAWHARFDGILACASLLHVPETEQARVWYSAD
jgi:2-polyprenyl-3-methyl-5-hydroxy-6-metoxy-1,4-benzoquinol methylase